MVANNLTIKLLGGFTVEAGTRSISDSEWDLRKAKSLVKLLALHDRHQAHREQVMSLLWPDLDNASGSNNLHKAIHIARRTLEPELAPKQASAYLHSRGDFLVLDPPGRLTIDVENFQAAAEAARAQRDPELFEEALSIYGGDLLPGDLYDDWCVAKREYLRGLRLELLIELAALHEGRGEVGSAIDALRELTAVDPAHEDATLRLMRLLVKSGSVTKPSGSTAPYGMRCARSWLPSRVVLLKS